MKVDVVIIGAGPGGGMAACRLAATGLKVMILEKALLPRHKPCGGALPGFIKRLFDWDLAPLIENEVTVKKSLYNYTQEQAVRIAPFLMVSRSRFDAHLIERAVSLGKGMVTLRDGFGVTHVEETASEVSLRGENGERILADFLYFCLPYGYGWVFPKKDGLLSCGVGAWHGRPHLPEAMDELLARSFPSGSIHAVKTFGHPVPLYSGHRQIATRRVCLVGDAASLVDPIMGEGIHFALKSGALAAEVIAGLAGVSADAETERPIPPWGEGDCRVYQSLIHEGMGKELDNLRRFVQLIFLDAPGFFYRKFILEGLDYAHLAQGLAQRLEEIESQ